MKKKGFSQIITNIRFILKMTVGVALSLIVLLSIVFHYDFKVLAIEGNHHVKSRDCLIDADNRSVLKENSPKNDTTDENVSEYFASGYNTVVKGTENIIEGEEFISPSGNEAKEDDTVCDGIIEDETYDNTVNYLGQQDADVLVVSDITELVDAVDDNFDGCFSSAVINPDDNTLIVDGVETNPEDVFGEQAKDENIIESIDSALTFFDGLPYETEIQEDGTLEITSPYQMKRVVVHADSLIDYCGAVSVINCPKIHEYILEFDSPEQTKVAFEVLSEEYGYDCYVDDLVSCEPYEITIGENWGYGSMGFQCVKIPTESVEKTTIVAVIDTGIDRNAFCYESGRVSGESYDLVGKTDVLTDSNGHGTHIAGIISQCTSDTIQVLAIRVFDQSGKTSWLMLNNALQYAMEHNADVINMSLGITTRLYESNYTELNAALEEAWGRRIPVLCAAGNEGLDVTHVYPACNAYTIAVSAIDRAFEFASSFHDGIGGSGYGTKIEFCAPGIDILSDSKGGGTIIKSGTSCATAFVSAAFAILKTMNPEVTVDQLINIAIKNSIDLGIKGKDSYYGWGLIRFFYKK